MVRISSTRSRVERIPAHIAPRFAKLPSYIGCLMDDKADCKNMRCRKRFDISGVKTMAFI